MMLSKFFSLSELTVTSTGLDNSPTTEHMEHLKKLAAFLDKIRAECGNMPITVTSAYRSEEVNHAVGGVANSDHPLGYAGDLKHSVLTPLQFAHKIAFGSLKGKFDQVILETSRGVVHVSVNPRMRGQVLTQPKGPGTPFLLGLPSL